MRSQLAGRGIPFSAMRAACDNDVIMKQIYGLEHVHGVWYYNNNTTRTTTTTAAMSPATLSSSPGHDYYCHHYYEHDYQLCLLIGMKISKHHHDNDLCSLVGIIAHDKAEKKSGHHHIAKTEH